MELPPKKLRLVVRSANRQKSNTGQPLAAHGFLQHDFRLGSGPKTQGGTRLILTSRSPRAHPLRHAAGIDRWRNTSSSAWSGSRPAHKASDIADLIRDNDLLSHFRRFRITYRSSRPLKGKPFRQGQYPSLVLCDLGESKAEAAQQIVALINSPPPTHATSQPSARSPQLPPLPSSLF